MSRALALAVCAAAAFGAEAAHAQTVVLEARGPSAGLFPKGKVLAPNFHIDLKVGDVLRVIDTTGVHTLTGPLGAAPAPRDARLAQIFQREDSRVSQLAVARGAPSTPRLRYPAGLWEIDVVSSSAVTACSASDVTPMLWRWSTDRTQDVEIVEHGGAEPQTFVWPAGAQTFEWPANLPIDKDNHYVVRLDDNPPVVVAWRSIGSVSGDMSALAQHLLDSGCTDQFHALEAVVQSDAAP